MVGHSVPKANLRVLDHLIGARHELAQVSNFLNANHLGANQVWPVMYIMKEGYLAHPVRCFLVHISDTKL